MKTKFRQKVAQGFIKLSLGKTSEDGDSSVPLGNRCLTVLMGKIIFYTMLGSVLLWFMTTLHVNLSKEFASVVFVIFSSVLEENRQGLKAMKILKNSVPMICWKRRDMGDSFSKGVQPLLQVNSEYDRADSWGTDSHPVVLVMWLL